MSIVTKYLFALDVEGHPITGTVMQYDDTPITVRVPEVDADGNPVLDAGGNPVYTTITEPAPIPPVPAEYTHEGDETIWLNQNRARFDYTANVWAPLGEPPVSTLPPQPETDTQKIVRLEADKVVMRQQLAQMNYDFTAFQDFYFEKNPTQA